MQNPFEYGCERWGRTHHGRGMCGAWDSVLFLRLDDASYITGTTLTPDGGCHRTI